MTSPQPPQHINYPIVPAQPQLAQQQPMAVPQMPPQMQAQQTVPPLNMPPTSMPVGVAGQAPDDPLINSPASEGLSIGDFADYLSVMDTDIDKCRYATLFTHAEQPIFCCRDLIGDQWDTLDIDGLLEDDPSPTSDGISQLTALLAQCR